MGVKNSDALRDAYEAVQSEVVTYALRQGQSRPIYDALVALKDGPDWSKLDAERELAHHRAGAGNGGRKRGILRRVESVQGGTEHRDGPPPAPKRTFVGGGVDTAGQTRNHDRAGCREIAPESPGQGAPLRRSRARPHDRDRRSCIFGWRQRPTNVEDRRGIVGAAQEHRVDRIVPPHYGDSEPKGGLELQLRAASGLSGPQRGRGRLRQQVAVITRARQGQAEGTPPGQLSYLSRPEAWQEHGCEEVAGLVHGFGSLGQGGEGS
jgi:hypothetical protein